MFDKHHLYTSNNRKERDRFGYPLFIKSMCDLNKIIFQVLFYYQGVCHSPNQSDRVALDWLVRKRN